MGAIRRVMGSSSRSKKGEVHGTKVSVICGAHTEWGAKQQTEGGD